MLEVRLPVLRQFVCDPAKYCEGKSLCCQNHDTPPGMNVIDFYRLSRKTGQPVTEIWRENGTVVPVLTQGGWIIALGLRHNPCPYLSNVPDCAVHDSRPLNCAFFPFSVFLTRRDQLPYYQRIYPCIDGAQPTGGQIRFSAKLLALFNELGEVEVKYFWQGIDPVIGEMNTNKLGSLLKTAQELAPREAPHAVASIATAWELYLSRLRIHQAAGSQGPVNLEGFFHQIVGSALYALCYREFAARLSEIEKFHLSVFAALNDRIVAIFRKYGM